MYPRLLVHIEVCCYYFGCKRSKLIARRACWSWEGGPKLNSKSLGHSALQDSPFSFEQTVYSFFFFLHNVNTLMSPHVWRCLLHGAQWCKVTLGAISSLKTQFISIPKAATCLTAQCLDQNIASS